MKDDLISREELKKEVDKLYDETLDAIVKFGIEKVYELINNALAVEPKQGEWKITDSYPHKVYCDKCFKTYAQANWEVWKDGTLARDFCPNCGSKMKGGAK